MEEPRGHNEARYCALDTGKETPLCFLTPRHFSLERVYGESLLLLFISPAGVPTSCLSALENFYFDVFLMHPFVKSHPPLSQAIGWGCRARKETCSLVLWLVLLLPPSLVGFFVLCPVPSAQCPSGKGKGHWTQPSGCAALSIVHAPHAGLPLVRAFPPFQRKSTATPIP